jgi:hypothetical protein
MNFRPDGSGYRSPLGRMSASGKEPNEAEARAVAAKAWHETDTLLIRRSWLKTWPLREMFDALGGAMYGKRKGDGA